jgi:hypothetical protein
MLALPSGVSPALTLTAMTLGFAVVQLDVTIMNVALKTIGSSLSSAFATSNSLMAETNRRRRGVHPTERLPDIRSSGAGQRGSGPTVSK